ncbi:MAG: DUF885 domain-containing protein [Thermomicrobiales bacterium]
MRAFPTIAAAAEAFLTEYCAMYPRERALYNYFPGGAAHFGIHTGAGKVPDYRPEAVAARLRAVAEWHESFGTLEPLVRDDNDRLDLAIMRWIADAEHFALAELQPHRTVPAHYASSVDITHYLRRDYAPRDERLRGLVEQLEQVPGVLAVARENLDTPIAAPILEYSRGAFAGHAAFIGDDLLALVADASDVALRERIAAAAHRAVAAIEDFERFLDTKESDAATASFAIGEERFLGLLRTFEQVDLSLAELKRHGQADLARNQARLREVCAQIDPDADPQTVIAGLRRDHPPADGLVPATAALLESLRSFLIERDLVGVPSEVRCAVEEIPPFFKWAFAMMDYPGGLDREDAGAYYWVNSPDPAWTAADQAAWMARYTYPALANLSAHEAYPGHYLQSIHNHHAPTTLAKCFGAFTHWEGWAHYCEELMVEAGYLDGDPAFQVAQLQGALLRDARYLVAIGLHCEEMTIEEATTLIMEATQLARLPAAREAMRGAFDPGYGCYTLGKLLVKQLRRDAEREWGADFSLRRFHDALLAHGSPPLAILRPRLLKEASQLL